MSIGQCRSYAAVAAGCTLTKRNRRKAEITLRRLSGDGNLPAAMRVPGGPTFAEPWAGPTEITPVPQAPDQISRPHGSWSRAYVR